MKRKYVRGHFLKLGAPERSLDRWLNLLNQNKTLVRKIDKGRPTVIATKPTINKIKRKFNNKSGCSQRRVARSINCHYSYVSKILKKHSNIRCYKKN